MTEQDQVLAELKEEVAKFPTKPGVYIMKDRKGEVIYVGKAKNLRARVKNYFGTGDNRYQLDFLRKRVATIEKILTDSEENAFVLERDLIGKHKPRYNIRLKDDKAYLNVRIDRNDPWPRIELTRRVQEDGAEYFGPYTYSYELRTVLDVIKKVVPLRTCTNTVFYNRQRPCLEYQIKRCAGPCCLEVDPDQYQDWVDQAIKILQGKTAPLVEHLTEKMETASEELRFEDAASFRDKIDLLESFGKGLQFVSTGGEDRDVFALERQERLVAISVLQVRRGRICDSVNFHFAELEFSSEEVLLEAMEQFYDRGREIPDEILLPFEVQDLDFLQKRLKERAGRKVDFLVPQRGIRMRLVKLAELNAKEHFRSTFNSEQRYQELASKLARTVKMSQVPRKIECVDISHFQGSDKVGALVCFVDGKPEKQGYRKYKLSDQGKNDDFASIYEVVSRRLKRGLEEDDLPDLLIIDGGKGQLDAALRASDDVHVAVDIVGLAKMRVQDGLNPTEVEKSPERFFLPGIEEAIPLAAGDELTHFAQKIRDEVHRFVITFHRSSRAKSSQRSVLDGISGVGPQRKERILRNFGSVANLKNYSVDEIMRRAKVPRGIVEKILEAIAE